MILRLLDEDIKISFQFADDLGYIKADPGQIEQVLINLIVNARDAIRQKDDVRTLKEIYIETKNIILDQSFVDQHPGSSLGPHVQLSIEDSGIGMDEKTQAKIFEPFFTTKRENEGTGLGLATVYGIVKQNNGSVYVYSEPGMGSTFQIFWPAALESATLASETMENEIIPGGRETILLVEDNYAVREFTHEALEALGYTVYVAENGRKALELVQLTGISVDLLITDVIMPEIGGRELVNKLLATQKMQVLYTSGYTDQHIVREGILEEGVNFLQKPYALNKLATKIRSILSD
jgi:CheY-like chemotaxis protein